MTKQEMKKMLREQKTPYDDLENLLAFTDTKRYIIFNVIDAFNYGLIQGKRIERLKKHSGLQSGDS